MTRVLLVFMTLITGCYAQPYPGCGTVAPTNNYCAADLVIAMDYSKSMTNQFVYSLAQFVLQNFTNYLPISTTYVRTSIYGYGLQTFMISDVFTNYSNVCNVVQTQCNTYNREGSSELVTQLSELFKLYASIFENSQRPFIPAKFVVFTAINDQANIEAAIPYTKNITAMGSSIIIIGLNQTNPAWLQELSNTTYFFNFSGPVVNLTQFLLTNICTYDLTTPAPQTTPASSDNSLSDEIGTACANDPSNLWLDIIVAIDNTSSMASGVNNIAAILSTVFSELSIAQNGTHHYTRVGIIIFDSEATIYANLTSYSSQDELQSGLIPLFSTPPGTVETLDITKALQKAYAMFTDQSPGNQRNARKVVLLFASTYNRANDPSQVASEMKNMYYFIIGVDYNEANGLTTDLLKNITSPGMFFYASDGEGHSRKEPLFNELLDAFSYANCMCPSTMIQFIAINETTGNAKYYADCFQGEVAGNFAKFAELGCEVRNGTLVSLTSQIKENFLYQNLQDAKLLPAGSSHFHIGLTSTNGNLNWYNYNKTQIPLGSYTNWASGTGTGDYCVYSENLGPNKWGWLTEACVGANPFSYICQYRACDADDDCEIDRLKKQN